MPGADGAEGQEAEDKDNPQDSGGEPYGEEAGQEFTGVSKSNDKA
jgi:hypothetical protein